MPGETNRAGSDPPRGPDPARIEPVAPTHRRTNLSVVQHRFDDGLLAREWECFVCRCDPVWMAEDAREGSGALATVQGRVRILDACLDGCSRRQPFTVADLLVAIRGSKFVELLLVALQFAEHAGDCGVICSASPHRCRETRCVETVHDGVGNEGIHLVSDDEGAAATIATGITAAHVAAAAVAATRNPGPTDRMRE